MHNKVLKNDYEQTLREYERKGYVEIGLSTFTWGGSNFYSWRDGKKNGQHPQLVAWADSVDADLVIWGIHKGEKVTSQKIVKTPVTEKVEVEVKDNDLLSND